MEHIFSTGEILYKQNVKQIEEGSLVAESLEYEVIKEDTVIKCKGKLDNKNVKVLFKIDASYIPEIQFKQSVNILMQTDLYESQWTEYEIIETD